MNELLMYISDNKEWIFSGIGIVVIGFIISGVKKAWVSRNNVMYYMKQMNSHSADGTQIGTQNNFYGKKDENDK